MDMQQTFIGKKLKKSFLIFGNSGKIWLSIFHVRRVLKAGKNYGRNEAAPAIDRGGRKHICTSFRTIRSTPRSPVWPQKDSKVAKKWPKTQKMQKLRAVAIIKCSRQTMPEAQRPCQSNTDHAEGMETMPQAWRLCQWHGDDAKGMQTTPKAG